MRTLRNIQKRKKISLENRPKLLHFVESIHNMHEEAIPIRIKWSAL